jgi:hypothetical protein
MMKMKRITNKINIVLLVLLVLPLVNKAQTEVDALRYTKPFVGSTARSAALGGAFGAVGADFSSASINPAGLAFYRKSEFVFTPSVQNTTHQSKFFGNSSSDYKSSINLSNWGLTLISKRGKDDNFEEWKYVNFSFGMNRYDILSSNTTISGNNSISSISDDFLSRANGSPSEDLDPFISGLAYNAYFLNDDTLKKNNYYAESYGQYKKQQTKTIRKTGSIGETVLSLAGNYANRWYVGATIGISKIVYSENSQFTEKDSYHQLANFKEFISKEQLSTKGSGLNIKLGVIYKPADWIRLGTSIHSATSYSLTDIYSVEMITTFDTTETKNAVADNGLTGYSYKLRTPMRVVNSLAFIIGKRGFISIDHEWLNYSKAYYRPVADLDFANRAINDKFTQAHNIKAGAEINLNPMSIRFGYNILGNAFKSNFNSNSSSKSYTFGVGYREANFFLDAAVVYTQMGTDAYYMYSCNYVPSAKISSQRTTFVAGIGMKW